MSAADPQARALAYTPEEAEANAALAARMRAAYAAAYAAEDNAQGYRVLAERYAGWAAHRPALEPEHYRDRYVREAEHFSARYAAARAAACAAWSAAGEWCVNDGPTACLTGACPYIEATP